MTDKPLTHLCQFIRVAHCIYEAATRSLINEHEVPESTDRRAISRIHVGNCVEIGAKHLDLVLKIRSL
jgi:hypothetical protein